MAAKIPHDAFDYYVSLGPDRSYQAVADHFGCTKRGVTKRAGVESWADRLADIEREARRSADAKLSETMAEQKARHLKLVRAMGTRAAQALQQYPLTSGMEAIKAAETVIKLERLLNGEASDRTAIAVEDVTRDEVQRLLRRAPEEEDAEDDDW